MLNIKSKALKAFTGLMVAFILVAGVGMIAKTVSADTITIPSNGVKKTSSSANIKSLQTFLNWTLGSQITPLVVDGKYGAKTTAAIKMYQSQNGLTSDGLFGPLSAAKAMALQVNGNSGNNGNNGNGGCSAGQLFNPNTGLPCNNNNQTPQSGPVTVSLSMDNPASGTVVTGQATADLAHFTFTGSGTVTQMTLQRTGISTSSTLQSVYLYQGATRLTDSATVNTNGVITFNGLNLMVNGSATVSVKADIQSGSTASGQTVGVALKSFMTAGNATAMNVNVAGNMMYVSDGTGVLAGVQMTGTTSPSSAQTVNAGVSNYTLWSTPVQVNTRSVVLRGASFHFIGSAPTDSLQNIKLYVNGLPVATASGVNSLGYIVFDLSAAPLTLNTGSSTVDVRADIVKGSARSFNLTLQNSGDFMVADSQLGVNVSVCTATCSTTPTFSSVAASTISVNTGSVSVAIDPTFGNMTNVTGGATNTTIAKYKLRAYGEDVKVQSLSVTPNVASGVAAGSSDLNSLNNVALYFNGSQVGSSANWTSGAMTFQLGSSMIIPAGVDSYLEVRADAQTSDNYNFTSGTITVALNTGTNNGQGMSSLDSTIDVPPATVTTSGLAISTGVLAVAANPAYTAQSVSPNQAGVKIGSFVLQNQSTSESVRVTNLGVSVAFGAGAGSTNLSNLRTSETSGSGATPINPSTAAASASSSNNFSVDFVLAPGAVKVIDIYGDVGASVAASTTMIVSLTPTALGVSSNVNVTPSAATGQTITVNTGTFGNAGIIVSSTSAPQYVATGSTGAVDATKATFNFKATSGTATVSELKFRVTTSTGASVSSVRVGTVTAPVVSGVAYLTGLNIAVPNGGSGVNVDAFLSYGPTGTNGNTSGAESFTEMTYIKYSIGGSTTTTVGGQSTVTSNTAVATTASGTFAAVGSTASITVASTAALQPGMLLVADHGTTDSVVMVQSITSSTVFVAQTVFLGTAALAGTESLYFFSVPQNAVYASTVNNCSMTMSDAGTTVAVGSTSGTDCMSIVGSKPSLGVMDSSALLTNSSVKVGSVTVMADAKGDIAINALPITLSSSGATACTTCTVTVKNAADGSTITTTNTTLTYAGGASDETVITFVGGYTITAGQTVVFDIYVTPISTDADDSLTMSLTTPASFLWTDVAGNGSSGAESGTLLPTYPTATSSIQNF